MSTDLAAVLAAIDDANAADPNQVEGQPLALLEGRRASAWVERLSEDPPATVLTAARAHHLTRWKVPRGSYPEGRAGYLRWRRDQKLRHATDIEAILADHGLGPTFISRVQELLERRGLGSDPEVQLVEDAACLVFLETRYDDMIDRLDHDQLIGVLRKTLAKMSPAAIGSATSIAMSDAARACLTEATD